MRPGTAILAIGSFGTGYREFLRTAAIMHGNWQAESGLFDLEYGTLGESVLRPSQVRYISVNDSTKTFRRHIHDLADEVVAYPALDQIDVRSLSAEIADLGPIQPSVEGGFEYRSAGERPSDEYEQIFQRFDDLVDGVPGEVVFVDAISDFLPITAKFLEPIDLYFISQTLCHVVAESNSILIAAADRDLLSQKEAALLRRTFEAVLDFEWFGPGSQQRRMMTVTKFPEFWRETEDNEHVTFDLEIDREHFGISKVKKIPPGR